MSNPLVLSKKDCQGKTWLPPKGAELAACRALVPLHAGEIAKAAATMPLAIWRDGKSWHLVGVCGTEPGHNLFVKDIHWLGGYRPQWIATYPFDVVTVGKKCLITFEQDSGLLAASGEGEPFFDDQGQMSGDVAERVDRLQQSHGKQLATGVAVQALVSAGVVAPWPETLMQELGITIEGLHMIDEPAMARLADADFLALRKAQALPLAYGVNLSLPQTHLLNRLRKLNPAKAEVPDDLDSLFSDDDDLNFDF